MKQKVKLQKKKALEEHVEELEKKMNEFWGFSDDTNIDGDNVEKPEKNDKDIGRSNNKSQNLKRIQQFDKDRPLLEEKKCVKREENISYIDKIPYAELKESGTCYRKISRKKGQKKEKNNVYGCEDTNVVKKHKSKNSNTLLWENNNEEYDNSIVSGLKEAEKKKRKGVFNAISNVKEKLPKIHNKKNINDVKGKTNEMKGSKEQTNNQLTEKEKHEIWKAQKEERRTFKKIVQEVRNVAKHELDKFQKTIVLNREIKELGGKFDKSRKMPYPELIYRKKAMKRNIEKRKKLEHYAGVKFQSGDYTDMQDVFRNKKRKEKKKRERSFKLF